MARAAIDKETGVTEKQEAFAVEYVRNGGNATAAYIEVYETANMKGATINREAKALMDNPKIATRIAFHRAMVAQVAIEEAALDKAWILKRLKIVAERCLQSAPVLDRKGFPVLIETPKGDLAPAYVFDAKGANGALNLLGQAEGSTFVKKVEKGNPGDFERLNMDKEELRKRIKERSVRLGLAKVVPIEKAKRSKAA